MNPTPPYKKTRKEMLLAFDRKYIVRVLKEAGLNMSVAAKIAGIDRKHLWRLMQRCGVRIE